jgi:uncharacterized membrane protein YjgN (DUF898 family)
MTDSIPPIEAAAPPAFPFPSPPTPAPRGIRVHFSGNAAEYFGIWIVNLFLTIVTLGIYSAWAKVRRKRYFYGNTWLADSNFEYHGNAIAILKGRLLAFTAFVAYTLATQYSPRLGAILLVALMPAVPWLIVRSFAFNAVNSSYRNLRFHFDGRYREAALAIGPFFLIPLIGVLLPEVDADNPRLAATDMALLLATPLLAMLFYPYVIARVKLLQVNRSRFGTAPFHCRATVANFYRIYIFAAILFALMGAAIAIAVTGLVIVTFGVGIMLVPVIYVLGGAAIIGYTRSRVGNLVFNKTSVAGGRHFRSTLSARKLTLIYATNLAAIIFSLGLAIPWAAIRTARYRAECLALEGGEDLDRFMADQTRQVSATGEEMGEMFDVDLSL